MAKPHGSKGHSRSGRPEFEERAQNAVVDHEDGAGTAEQV